MKKEMIAPFNPQDAEVRANVQRIMDAAPVKNLTQDEVLQTLRLVQLERLLRDDKRTSRFAVGCRLQEDVADVQAVSVLFRSDTLLLAQDSQPVCAGSRIVEHG